MAIEMYVFMSVDVCWWMFLLFKDFMLFSRLCCVYNFATFKCLRKAILVSFVNVPGGTVFL